VPDFVTLCKGEPLISSEKSLNGEKRPKNPLGNAVSEPFLANRSELSVI
jgi:hypothetical protein